MALKVAELFAGVGGFRLGLEKNGFKIIWSNQWEPSTKKQHASIVYEARFGNKGHSNKDIALVAIDEIPDHDLLCGGFPCQDYSVATTLNNSKGLKGKKGVLWWSIHRILEEKKNKRPKYLFLENVDRLLKSPGTQRGRDFAVMLQSLNELGYAIEWRVINAADYGMPQKRRRVFFLGYHRSSQLYKKVKIIEKLDWILDQGTIAHSFPIHYTEEFYKFKLEGDLVHITNNFNIKGGSSPFMNTGIMVDGKVCTANTEADHEGRRILLGDILQKGRIKKEFLINKSDIHKWEYLKGSKKEERISKTGHHYNYSEGGMIFPDSLDGPSRTIITGEGGPSASRFKHVVKTKNGLRRLTPVELERLNMFPDGHTKHPNVTNAKRAFFMGNALVVGIVDRIGRSLIAKLKE